MKKSPSKILLLVLLVCFVGVLCLTFVACNKDQMPSDKGGNGSSAIEPTPAPDTPTEPEPDPEPTPDPTPNPEPTPNPDPTPEPTPNPDPTPEPEPEPEPEPLPEVQLVLDGSYRIGSHILELARTDMAFAYNFTFGNGDTEGITLNRSTLTYYDIPLDAKYIEMKAIGGVYNGVKYLDSNTVRYKIPISNYTVKYRGKILSILDVERKELRLLSISELGIGKRTEESGENALVGTPYYKGEGGYMIVEGKDTYHAYQKIYWRIPHVKSLGELFDKIPDLLYYDVVAVERIDDTNRFELEDYKYYMQNEIIPYMQKNYPRYAEFFKTTDMNDYEIRNYIGYGEYDTRYDHERQYAFADLKNKEGRTLHLELSMDMLYGSVGNWKYVREHKMLFSQVKTVDPYMTEKLHSFDVYPMSYFDDEGDRTYYADFEYDNKIIKDSITDFPYIYPTINYYLEGEQKDEIWERLLSDSEIYEQAYADEIREKLKQPDENESNDNAGFNEEAACTLIR